MSRCAEHAAADAGAPHPGLHRGHGGRIQPGRGVKDHTRSAVVAGGLEYPVEDAAVKAHVRVQGRAEG